MYILGFSCFAHDAAACLIKDGQLLVTIEEERFSREKHTWKFPKNAIRECLKFEGIEIDDIDHFAFFYVPWLEIVGNASHFLRYFPASLNLFRGPSGSDDLGFFARLKRLATIGKMLQAEFKLAETPKVEFIEHHLCHAANCFFIGPFEDAAILTIDGRGEHVSTMFAVGHGRKIEKLREISVPHSIGYLYAAITDYLGFRAFFDEWKVMGMSAYGTDALVEQFSDLVHFEDRGEYELNLEYFKFHTHGRAAWLSEKFFKCFGPARTASDPLTQQHFDLAFALQRVTEELGVHLAQELYRLTKLPNLCLSGGVVLNVLMNKKIVEQTPFTDFFFQPIAGDAGTCVGAAYFHYHQNLGYPRSYRFESPYLGTEYDSAEIERELTKRGLKFSKPASIEAETAKRIADGKIVGWFQGRMEAGPRALGNRSIVVDPRDPGMKDKLNARVKRRESFRPFAPSVLEEKVSQIFSMPKNKPSPYMILAGDVLPGKGKLVPAITHADNTARVHTVSKRMNPRYWNLISEFDKLTGVPLLLNTSFNENEPIVCTPHDAIECFLRTEFDTLAIGDYLVDKGGSR